MLVTVRYWKNSSGKYIKLGGAYSKCESCPCVPCPTDCSACATNYSVHLPATTIYGPCTLSGSYYSQITYTFPAQDVVVTRSGCAWVSDYISNLESHSNRWPQANGGCTGTQSPGYPETNSAPAYRVFISCSGTHWYVWIQFNDVPGWVSFLASGENASACPNTVAYAGGVGVS